MSAWSKLGITHTFTTSSSDCDIHIKGVSRIEAIYIDSTTTNACGLTRAINSDETVANYIGLGYTPSKGWVNIYESSKRKIYLIWDTQDDGYNDKTSHFSDSKWKVVTAHELGHALGYEGHNSIETLMFKNMKNSYPNGYTTPTTAEINHLKQIYGADKY